MIRTRKGARARLGEALAIVEEVLEAEERAMNKSKGARGILSHAAWLSLLATKWSLTAATHREWGTS